jgi:hypothetical protein
MPLLAPGGVVPPEHVAVADRSHAIVQWLFCLDRRSLSLAAVSRSRYHSTV